MAMTKWGLSLALICVTVCCQSVEGQETIGKRLFSDTLTIPEPFVEDELSFPSVFYLRGPGRSPISSVRVGAEVKKRITRDFELSVGTGVTQLTSDERGSAIGFDNLEVDVKYQLLTDEARELVLSASLGWEIGSTGRTASGASPFDTVSPALLAGKGFGDLPDGLALARPFAATAIVGAEIPTLSTDRTTTGVTRHPNVLRTGLVIEYSLVYLQAYVTEVTLPALLNRLIVLAEFDLNTPVDRGRAGRSTGTVNPGVVWVGTIAQIGIEAVVPVNERTSRDLGVRAFVRFALEELFGDRFGEPVFRRH